MFATVRKECTACGGVIIGIDGPHLVCSCGGKTEAISSIRLGDEFAKKVSWFGGRDCGVCGDMRGIMNMKNRQWVQRNKDRLVGWMMRFCEDKGIDEDEGHLHSVLAELLGQPQANTADNVESIAELSGTRHSVVWVYWAGGAHSNELLYSMRSAEHHLSDIKNIVLCGSKPDWYIGDHIPSRRFNERDAKKEFGTSRWAKEVDSIVKLQRIIDSDLVTENFLWMYDDTFIVKPFSIAQIAVPRAGGLLHYGDLETKARHKWREALRRTALALRSRGRPIRNYSTHYPVVFNKTRLRQTLEEFDPRHSPRCIESLYLNHHATSEPKSAYSVFMYSKKPMGNWKPRSTVPVVNVGGFNLAARKAIQGAGFPACSVEQEKPPEFKQGRVGFLVVSYMPEGGTEVWHQSLIPKLKGVVGFVVLDRDMARGDFTKLGCPYGVGMEAARKLAASVDVLVVWGVGKRLGGVLADAKPRVVSVTHGDKTSWWSTDMMHAQAEWSAQSVYLCPTGRENCPPDKPAIRISNAPNPSRVTSLLSRPQARRRLGITSNEKMLLSISRLSEEKQIDKLVKAMRFLPKQYQLVIAGSVDGRYHRYAKKLQGMSCDRVQFVGNVDPPMDLFVAADAFLSASQIEGYGLSMAEAMLAGVPVVATKTGLLEDAPESAKIMEQDAAPKQWAAAIIDDFANREAQAARTLVAKQNLNTMEQFAADWQSLIDNVD